jgi:hypothetical protein
MTRILPHTVEEYERFIVEVARQEGLTVETIEGSIYFNAPAFSPSGEKVFSKVNITRFAEGLARKLS